MTTAACPRCGTFAPLITTEWYCPGPGLVKLTRAEPTANSTFLSGGSFTMELTEWQ